MPVSIFIIIAVLFGGSFLYIFYMNKKRKESIGKYDNPEMYQQAEKIKEELLTDRFSAIVKQMQNAPIDAFTQCAYITTMTDKAKSAAVTAVKTVAWAAVGVKAKYREADNAAYLVISGDELHYLFFEEGAAKEHLVFNRMRLLNAGTGTVSSTEKVARMGSVMGRKNNKLSIDIDGRKTDIIYYDMVERYPESVIATEKASFDAPGKFKLMGKYFKDKLFAKYPHLTN